MGIRFMMGIYVCMDVCMEYVCMDMGWIGFMFWGYGYGIGIRIGLVLCLG
jgi:hypothetical protein